MIVAIILLVLAAAGLVGGGFLIWKFERIGLGILSGVTGALFIPSGITALNGYSLWGACTHTPIPEWLGLANFSFFVVTLFMLLAAICIVAAICAFFTAIGNSL